MPLVRVQTVRAFWPVEMNCSFHPKDEENNEIESLDAPEYVRSVPEPECSRGRSRGMLRQQFRMLRRGSAVLWKHFSGQLVLP